MRAEMDAVWKEWRGGAEICLLSERALTMDVCHAVVGADVRSGERVGRERVGVLGERVRRVSAERVGRAGGRAGGGRTVKNSSKQCSGPHY